MKPLGIRKVIAERSLEGAVIYLAEELEKLRAEIENNRPLPVLEPVAPLEEGAP